MKQGVTPISQGCDGCKSLILQGEAVCNARPL